MKPFVIVLTLMSASAVPALAANADAPQTNVDKGNDAGNSTGNDKVDALNRGQLDANQKPAGAAAPVPSAPNAAPVAAVPPAAPAPAAPPAR